MNFTLLTYDSMLAHNAGYTGNSKVVDFTNTLARLLDEFSRHSGVKKEDVYWLEVDQSDWCKRCVILYAKVDPIWTPTEKTFVIGSTYDPSWHPNLTSSLNTWIRGGGHFVNIVENPAQNPHSLYRTLIT